MSAIDRLANQERIKSARYPTTITNRFIPAAWEAIRMCSRSGTPRSGTRGLGTPPDNEAIRLPLPAARIRQSLTGGIGHLDEWRFPLVMVGHLFGGHHGVIGRARVRRLRGVVEILNVYFGRTKNACFGDAFGREGKPEGSTF